MTECITDNKDRVLDREKESEKKVGMEKEKEGDKSKVVENENHIKPKVEEQISHIKPIKRKVPEEIEECLANELNPRIKLELIRQCSLTSVERTSEQYKIGKDLLWEWRSLFNSFGEEEFLKRENTRLRFMSRKKKALILREVELKGEERVSAKYGVSKGAIKTWQRLMSAMGKSKFLEKGSRGWKGGKVYTREEKMGIVFEAESHGFHEIGLKYDIAKCTLENWKNRLANFGQEGLTQRIGSGSGNGKNLYTMEKRVEIVQYYMNHGLKAAARHYGCNTPCIYAWKTKIQQLGVNGFLGGKGYAQNNTHESNNENNENNENNSMKVERNNEGEVVTTTPEITNKPHQPDSCYVISDQLLKRENNHNSEGNKKQVVGIKGNRGRKLRPRIKSGLENGNLQIMENQGDAYMNNINTSTLISPIGSVNPNNHLIPNNQDVKYKNLFKGEMKKLLPMQLYHQFKNEFKKMVQKYQFKALEVYSNYDQQ